MKTLLLILVVLMAAPLRDAYADGNLDTSFGSGGKIIVPIDEGMPLIDTVADVLTAKDNKIYLVGTASRDANSTTIAIVRLKENGTVDTTFGTGGVALPDDNFNISAKAAAFDRNGNILIAAERRTASRTYFALCRVSPLGTEIPTDGAACNVIDLQSKTPIVGTSWTRAQPHDILLLSDGGIVMTGAVDITMPEANTIGLLARFTPSGALDSTYWGDGLAFLVDGDGARVEPYAAAQIPDALDLFVVGSEMDGSQTFAFASRVTAFGGFDDYTNFCDSDVNRCEFRDVARTRAGYFAVAGFRQSGANAEGVVALYTANVSVVPGWGGSDGLATIAKGTGIRLTRVLPQSDGKLLYAGTYMPDAGTQRAIVGRFNTTSGIDSTFNPPLSNYSIDFGVHATPFDLGAAMTLQSGRAVVAASVTRSNGYDFGAARFTSDSIFFSDFEK